MHINRLVHFILFGFVWIFSNWCQGSFIL